MDTFVEQIVAIKKTVKTWGAYFLIAILAIVLLAASMIFIKGLFVVAAALIFYGVFKLYSMFNIEYEYIITNSTMDIDKIIAKSSRKRVVSFDLTAVQRVEKFSGKLPANIANDCFFACNRDDENALILFYKQEGKPQKTFVFAPNERTRTAMKNFLPHHLGENL